MTSRKSSIGAFVVAVAVSALVFSLQASGARSDHGHGNGNGHKLLQTNLIGNNAGELAGRPADAPIHGITTAGRSWNVDRGSASLSKGGKFRLRVRGLVLASGSAIGTNGGIAAVQAALFCGPDTETTPAFVSAPVPFSADGDARVKAHIAVPSRCIRPVVLVLIANGTRFIAASGFTS
jgi:hypothetical protein